MIDYPLRDRVIGRIVADKAALHGDRVFMRFEQREVTYRDLDRLSNRLANGLARMGVGKGTHVALMIDNKPEIVLLYVALGKLGAVSVPLNTAAKGELLAYYVQQSNSELLVADGALIERLAPIASQLKKLRGVLAFGWREVGRHLVDAPVHERLDAREELLRRARSAGRHRGAHVGDVRAHAAPLR